MTSQEAHKIHWSADIGEHMATFISFDIDFEAMGLPGVQLDVFGPEFDSDNPKRW